MLFYIVNLHLAIQLVMMICSQRRDRTSTESPSPSDSPRLGPANPESRRTIGEIASSRGLDEKNRFDYYTSEGRPLPGFDKEDEEAPDHSGQNDRTFNGL